MESDGPTWENRTEKGPPNMESESGWMDKEKLNVQRIGKPHVEFFAMGYIGGKSPIHFRSPYTLSQGRRRRLEVTL